MIRNLATLALLAGALALHLHGLVPHVAQSNYDFDAIHVYLPYAQRFLAEGWHFLLTEDSIHAPPFTYIYPAILGAELATVKNVNAALSCVLLLLIFRTGDLWHSRAAGLCAALLYAASPLLKPFLATAVTEPPFLFLAGVWIWALSEWMVRDRPVYIPIAGIALGLALLTRASLFYYVLALAIFFGVRRDRGAFAVHAIALVLPLAFIAKNLAVFDFGFYTTGGGNALYLGTNPATGGYDPTYLGLIYDVGAIARDQSHLTLEAERLLGGVGRMVLASLDPAFVAAMYAKKLVAFLFITNAETVGDLEWLRSWRIATLALALVGITAIAERRLRWIVGSLLAYQVAVHVPALYSHRYSVGALDMWLTLLAGCGLALMWERRRPVELAALAAVTFAAVLAGLYGLRHGGLPEPDVHVAANDLIWERRGEDVRLASRETVMEFEIRDAPKFHPWFNYVLIMETTLTRGAPDEDCGRLRILYKRDADKDFDDGRAIVKRLEADGRRHENQFGAIVPLKLNAQGRLRLEITCAAGSRLEIHRLAVYAPLGALEYRERYLASTKAGAAR